MAILKHLAIKKKDYTDIQQYLIFKCEEGTHKPLRDETGRMIQRDYYIQSGMNCDPFTFDADCVKLNQQFHKNNHKGDIMAHHYIISFDPRDAEDHGLTPEKAHELAEEFAEYFFAGHQALLVTHADGNNHTGNIHTHIVINSLRKYDVERKPFMENGRDCLAGYKHHLTDALLHRMHERLAEICERENHYTVNIDQPAGRNITDREYQAQQRGQREKDALYERIRADGYEPIHLRFDTVKQKIREAVDDASSRAKCETEFWDILQNEYRIGVVYKRGRYSYVHHGSKKPFTARSLGNAYAREAILEKLRMNAFPVWDDRPEYAALPRIFLIPSDLRLVVDLQSCVKAQQSRAYARKVEISNLQTMARTLAWIQENGFDTLDDLNWVKMQLENRYNSVSGELKDVKGQIFQLNMRIKHVGRYYANKNVYERYQRAEDRDAFRAERRSQIEAYEESVRALEDMFPDRSYPALKELRAEKEALTEKRDKLQTDLKSLSADMRNMKVVWKNVCTILGRYTDLVAEEAEENRRQERLRRRRREASL